MTQPFDADEMIKRWDIRTYEVIAVRGWSWRSEIVDRASDHRATSGVVWSCAHPRRHKTQAAAYACGQVLWRHFCDAKKDRYYTDQVQEIVDSL